MHDKRIINLEAVVLCEARVASAWAETELDFQSRGTQGIQRKMLPKIVILLKNINSHWNLNRQYSQKDTRWLTWRQCWCECLWNVPLKTVMYSLLNFWSASSLFFSYHLLSKYCFELFCIFQLFATVWNGLAWINLVLPARSTSFQKRSGLKTLRWSLQRKWPIRALFCIF